MNDLGVERLSSAIILRAVADYRAARNDETVNGKAPSQTIRECERFFLSDWFRLLTKLDGEVLPEKLQKED